MYHGQTYNKTIDLSRTVTEYPTSTTTYLPLTDLQYGDVVEITFHHIIARVDPRENLFITLFIDLEYLSDNCGYNNIPLTVTGTPLIDGKEWDGTTDVATEAIHLENCQLVGVEAEDEGKVQLTATAVYNNAEVGDNHTVTLTYGLNITDEDIVNKYLLDEPVVPVTVSNVAINKATLTADNFTVTLPENLVYDGSAYTATVTFDDQDGNLTGVGTVTVKYNGSTEAPVAASEYTVSIDVAEGTNFVAAEGLTNDAWKFTIAKRALETNSDNFEFDDMHATYDGDEHNATVTLNDNIIGAGEITVTYRQNGETVTPVNVGDYDIFVSVSEGANYLALEETPLLNGIRPRQMQIWKAVPTVDMFVYTAPENLVYDGTIKQAAVVFDDQNGKLTGMGNITITYKKEEAGQAEATGWTDYPKDPGIYQVYVDRVDEGANYTMCLDKFTKPDWKFTITQGVLTADDFALADIFAIYDGEAYTASVSLKQNITGAGEITAVTYQQGATGRELPLLSLPPLWANTTSM